jgi:single-strand DNA-binding protein
VLQGFNSTLTMLEGRGGGGGSFADEGSGDFGSSSPAPRRVAAAGGSRNGDMNDDIPF